ncbi:BapA/Bap/LapF family large adhesin [Pseudochrobactrum asaccharolyticum]|uniref:BapA/Bap/LapF family large adhesin n=1 Tax=Pseudochrobactrum asaccharolyticum TaxID=354351 RepID=UPI001473AF20|nr:BapA/Bap/LapF family large adhesin [Pseudochrobactrum asaccharolyticum]
MLVALTEGLNLQVINTPKVSFNVDAGHTASVTLDYGAALSVSLLGDYKILLQVKDANGNWKAVAGAGGEASILSLELLSNGKYGVNVDNLPPGEYRAFVLYSGVGVGLLGSLHGSVTDYDHTNPAGSEAESADGNVITDGTPDTVTETTIVAKVNNVDIPEVGKTITGQYGTLVIHQNGDYTYTPFNQPGNIGKVDHFEYTIRDTVSGKESTANLDVRIGSDSIDLEWTTPDGPATIDLVANDDTAEAGVQFKNVVEAIPNAVLGNFNTPFGAVIVPGNGNGQANFTIAAGDKADVIVSVGTTGLPISVLPSFTIKVYNGTTLVKEISGTALAGLPLIGSGIQLHIDGLGAGTYRIEASSVNTLGTGYSSNISVSKTVTHLTEFEVKTVTGVDGNILSNDGTSVSTYTKLQVQSGNSFVDATKAGTVIAGLYGTLTVKADGSYHYQPNTNIAHSTTDLTDTFHYKLVLPNGHEATADLVVTLDVHDGTAMARMAMTETALPDNPEDPSSHSDTADNHQPHDSPDSPAHHEDVVSLPEMLLQHEETDFSDSLHFSGSEDGNSDLSVTLADLITSDENADADISDLFSADENTGTETPVPSTPVAELETVPDTAALIPLTDSEQDNWSHHSVPVL